MMSPSRAAIQLFSFNMHLEPLSFLSSVLQCMGFVSLLSSWIMLFYGQRFTEVRILSPIKCPSFKQPFSFYMQKDLEANLDNTR